MSKQAAAMCLLVACSLAVVFPSSSSAAELPGSHGRHLMQSVLVPVNNLSTVVSDMTNPAPSCLKGMPSGWGSVPKPTRVKNFNFTSRNQLVPWCVME